MSNRKNKSLARQFIDDEAKEERCERREKKVCVIPAQKSQSKALVPVSNSSFSKLLLQTNLPSEQAIQDSVNKIVDIPSADLYNMIRKSPPAFNHVRTNYQIFDGKQ
jgi:hypothetical protein